MAFGRKDRSSCLCLLDNVLCCQFFCLEVFLGLLFQVILAAELLKSADELVKQKIHPTSVISGYRLACKYDPERVLLGSSILLADSKVFFGVRIWSQCCKVTS